MRTKRPWPPWKPWNGHLQLCVDFGHDAVTDEDRERAKEAAQTYLAERDVSPEDAQAEFQNQLEQLEADGRFAEAYSALTGLAKIWIDAESAAWAALTQRLADPDVAGCTITFW